MSCDVISFLEEGETICSLPQFKLQHECRKCTSSSKWRCDSGWCIPQEKERDGIVDCPNDSSDEQFSKLFYFSSTKRNGTFITLTLNKNDT